MFVMGIFFGEIELALHFFKKMGLFFGGILGLKFIWKLVFIFFTILQFFLLTINPGHVGVECQLCKLRTWVLICK